MKKWLITLVLTQLPVLAALAEPPSVATYTVTFDATWSAETHPESFPASAHFSGLIGGTHDNTISFWSVGGLATTGIKQMAEWGTQSTLAGEVQTEIATGHAGEVISDEVLWVTPGTTATTFTITPDHPLVSVVAMIAPSPDWFYGVDSLSLLDGEQWAAELIVPMYPYDAGTDSGTNYTSGDAPTNPPAPIAAITGFPFSPGVALGTLTFRLDAAASAPPPVRSVMLSAQPNPFNPATVLRYELPAGASSVSLAIYDARGRQVRRLEAVRGAGLHQIRWDGRSDRGDRSAAGVYFARLDADGVVAVQKLALVQ